MTTDLKRMIAKSYGVLEEMENAVCEAEERLREMTAEVKAWRVVDDHRDQQNILNLVSHARRLRTLNERLYP